MPVEKGMINTGFDDIADTIDIYSQTAVAVRSDGHHEVSAVVTGINNFQPKVVSKTCKILGSMTDENNVYTPPRLVIGNLTIPLVKNENWTPEGDVYVDIHGNITTS